MNTTGYNISGTPNDPGKDGETTSNNQFIPKDEAGYGLGYFDGDYKPIGDMGIGAADVGIWSNLARTNLMGTPKGLFNGNI